MKGKENRKKTLVFPVDTLVILDVSRNNSWLRLPTISNPSRHFYQPESKLKCECQLYWIGHVIIFIFNRDDLSLNDLSKGAPNILREHYSAAVSMRLWVRDYVFCLLLLLVRSASVAEPRAARVSRSRPFCLQRVCAVFLGRKVRLKHWI